MIVTSQRVCGGPLDKPKAVRPQRHVPKFGVCRLMFQLPRSLSPWPGEGHATAQIQVYPRTCQVERLSLALARQGTGASLHQQVPLPTPCRTMAPGEAESGHSGLASKPPSTNPAPSLHKSAHFPLSNATSLGLTPTISFTNVAMAFWLVSCHTLSSLSSSTTPAGVLQETQSPLFWGNNSGASRRTDWKGRGRG